jgi:hypothetical protein
MNLDALRVKERDALSVPELDFLDEKKEELSAGEREKFKLNAAAPAADDKDKISDEDKNLLAAVKSGDKKVIDGKAEVVTTEQLSRLEATAEQYRTEKVTTILDKHVKRGALKQDQTEFWSKQLLSTVSEDQRKGFEDALDALPSNELLAKENGTNEKGTGQDVAAGSTAREQMHTLAKAKVDEAAKAGKTLLYADALKQIYRESHDLKTQDVQDNKAKAGV